MNVGKVSKFLGLVFRQRVAEKIAAADFRASQIFQKVRLAQRRMKFDMKMKSAVVGAVGWSMVQRHDIGKWHAPEIVVSHDHDFQRLGKIAQFIRSRARPVPNGLPLAQHNIHRRIAQSTE